jgi:transcription initiation factor TFIIE subunit alpha
MEPVVKLVKLLGRMFYEPAYFIVLDMILHDRIVAEDVLAERLQMQLKQVNKMTIKLRDDRFLQSEARLEIREFDGKTLTRTYWYLDFKGLVEATRWRLKKMSRQVEEMIQRGAQGGEHGYKCGKCGKTYGLLDVDRLVSDFRKGTLACEVCKGEVEDEEAMSSAEAADLYSRMNQALRPIVALLKEIELANVSLGTSKPKSSSSPSGTTPTLVTSPSSTSAVAASPFHSSEGSLVQEKEKIINEMPVWHSHSTVSGQAVKFHNHSTAQTQSKASADSSEPKVHLPVHKRPNADAQLSAKKTKVEEDTKVFRGDGEMESDVMVKVQGKPVPLMQVTEADKLAMSKEENEAYCEEFMKIFGESSFI